MITKRIIHKDLEGERWNRLSLVEQLANVGCDIDRAIRWKNKGDRDTSQKALELLWFTVDDPKNKKSLKELVRMREVLLDYFYGANIYGYTDEAWQKYFLNYNYMAALQRGR